MFSDCISMCPECFSENSFPYSLGSIELLAKSSFSPVVEIFSWEDDESVYSAFNYFIRSEASENLKNINELMDNVRFILNCKSDIDLEKIKERVKNAFNDFCGIKTDVFKKIDASVYKNNGYSDISDKFDSILYKEEDDCIKVIYQSLNSNKIFEARLEKEWLNKISDIKFEVNKKVREVRHECFINNKIFD